MSNVWQRPPASRWPWAAAAIILIAVNVILLGTQMGQCIDYAAESGLESTCTVGPAIGWPAMWVVVVLSILVVAYCSYRIVRLSRPTRS